MNDVCVCVCQNSIKQTDFFIHLCSNSKICNFDCPLCRQKNIGRYENERQQNKSKTKQTKQKKQNETLELKKKQDF